MKGLKACWWIVGISSLTVLIIASTRPSMSIAQSSPRSEKSYRIALRAAEARLIQQNLSKPNESVFTRTGRTDCQSMRYFASSPVTSSPNRHDAIAGRSKTMAKSL